MRQHNRKRCQKRTALEKGGEKKGRMRARGTVVQGPCSGCSSLPLPSLSPKPKEGPGAWQVAGGRVGRAQASEAGFPATKQKTKQWGAFAKHKALRQPTPTHTLGWYWLGLILFLSFKHAGQKRYTTSSIICCIAACTTNRGRTTALPARCCVLDRGLGPHMQASQRTSQRRDGGALRGRRRPHIWVGRVCAFILFRGKCRGKCGSACFPCAFCCTELARRAEACRRVEARA